MFHNEDKIVGQSYIKNITNKNLTIISGEFKELNKKVLKPGQRIDFSFFIPEGYREFFHEFAGPKGVPMIYVGLVDENVHDPSILEADI